MTAQDGILLGGGGSDGRFRLTEPENAVAGYCYPVAACRSWKIKRSML
jgi:hypothetical protein